MDQRSLLYVCEDGDVTAAQWFPLTMASYGVDAFQSLNQAETLHSIARVISHRGLDAAQYNPTSDSYVEVDIVLPQIGKASAHLKAAVEAYLSQLNKVVFSPPEHRERRLAMMYQQNVSFLCNVGIDPVSYFALTADNKLRSLVKALRNMLRNGFRENVGHLLLDRGRDMYVVQWHESPVRVSTRAEIGDTNEIK